MTQAAVQGHVARRTPAILSMWGNSKMVMLTALSAGIYLAVLLPFKGIQVIPGFAEVRVGAAMPVALGFLFGPAGAWGAAIGNLIGDFFGTLSLGSFFGFWGNFLLGYVPYKTFQHLTRGADAGRERLNSFGGRTVAVVVALIAVAVAAKGFFIGNGINALGLVPYPAFATAVIFTNGIACVVLAPILIKLLYRRVDRMGLVWTDVMAHELRGRPLAARLQAPLLLFGAAGYLVAFVGYGLGLTGAELALVTLPFAAALVVAPFLD